MSELEQLVERLTVLIAVTRSIVDQTTAKRVLVDARAPTDAQRKRLKADAARKLRTSFETRLRRARAFATRPYADPSVLFELLAAAMRRGEQTKSAWEHYDAALDELLTAL